ncbi:expressed unknown protein [Seminavis robusta]|uniref:DUF6824 domain-containing protein n=1 Tax=Seminavis robusta TaxID=568900 RepID=A0A9N8EKD3_9STRA|nr:expressed unknown protein [Seminavis robusta]|eukprot:Sro1221_g253680.1 n/a (803) ;mRNA; r:17510-19918
MAAVATDTTASLRAEQVKAEAEEHTANVDQPTEGSTPAEGAATMASSEAATTATAKNATQNEDEGVEVVLGEQGPDQVVDSNGASPSRQTPDQNVFRGSAHSGRASRHPTSSSKGPYPPRGPPPPPYGVQGSGSFGYGRPDYPPPRPYPVPPYNPSGSFEQDSAAAAYHSRPPSHYSPHVQYPPPGGRYPGEDINVISPNHKAGDPKYRSSSAQRRPPTNYYQYPPASPVSRPGQTESPPRLRNFAVRRTIEGPYSKAQRSGDIVEETASWNPFPAPSRTASRADRPRPPLVTESSFDSDHFSNSHYSQQHPSHPPTPGSGAPNHDPTQTFYGPGGSWASFDSTGAHPPQPPPHYDDYSRGHSRHPPHTPGGHYPEPPYSPYSPHSHHSAGYHHHYSPGGAYYPPPDHYGSYHGYGPPPQSYEDDERGMLKDYHPDRDSQEVKSSEASNKKGKPLANKSATGIVLPAAAHEVDFDVTDPPAEPVCPPSTEAIVESLADVNTYDVLCGRGGGTNSQIGNKRFRKLVQEFQPTYLLARRKEKPLLARTIVLIIRKRGGHFLRKDDESGMLFEVGDAKAEAKTSQALREGLDVRATKSAANTLSDKKKKKKKGAAPKVKEEAVAEAAATTTEEKPATKPPEPPIETPKLDVQSPERTPERPTQLTKEKPPSPMNVDPEPESPPPLPKLADEDIKAGMVHPHSPEAMQFRKRRRMRALACGADKFFPDFCPPRADLARSASPIEDGNGRSCDSDGDTLLQHSPMRRASSIDDEDLPKSTVAPGCTAAALEIVTGAVTGGFCFGTSK